MAQDRKVTCVADMRTLLGEGPVWAAREQTLYWLDIEGRRIFRMDAGGAVASHATPLRIGSLAPRAGGGFIAGTERGIALVDLDERRFEIVADPEPDRPGNRFNDGKVDRAGRFWAGTMDDAERDATGALYRVDPDLRWARVDDGYKVANGPAFGPDGGICYHNDSARRVTFAFDLDEGGNVAGKRVFALHGERDGYPDGMTVDAEGCLWIAFWDGWCVRRFSPEGKCIERIAMPVQRATSCAFGGPGLDRLYVTSARTGLDEKALAMQPYAGGLFMLSAGVGGVAEIPFAG